MENKKVILTVARYPNSSKRGYTIYHNQKVGWQGTTQRYYGWYRLKSDAQKSADTQMKEYNKSLPDRPFIFWKDIEFTDTETLLETVADIAYNAGWEEADYIETIDKFTADKIAQLKK